MGVWEKNKILQGVFGAKHLRLEGGSRKCSERWSKETFGGRVAGQKITGDGLDIFACLEEGIKKFAGGDTVNINQMTE